MPSVLVKDMLTSAYRKAGVLNRAGSGYSPSQLSEALKEANSMLSSWQTERLLVYAIPRNLLNVTVGKDSYSIGQSGTPDWNLPRPPRIERASVLLNSSDPLAVELPMAVLELEDWQGVRQKLTQSSISYYLYYEPDVPNGTIHIWPVPSDPSMQVVLYLWQPLGSFTSDSQTIDFPDGYQRAIEYNLAIALNAQFPEAQLKPYVVAEAAESKAAIKRINMPIIEIQCDHAIVSHTGHYNIITDQYQR